MSRYRDPQLQVVNNWMDMYKLIKKMANFVNLIDISPANVNAENDYKRDEHFNPEKGSMFSYKP